MDVILLQPVERLGDPGALVRVKPGFARNYLIPRGLAAPATSQQVHAAAETRAQQSRKAQRLQQDAEALKQRLESRVLTVTLRVGADDKPFGAVTAHDLVEALGREGVALEKHALRLAEPIKTLGTVEVPVRLHPDVTAILRVVVEKT